MTERERAAAEYADPEIFGRYERSNARKAFLAGWDAALAAAEERLRKMPDARVTSNMFFAPGGMKVPGCIVRAAAIATLREGEA